MQYGPAPPIDIIDAASSTRSPVISGGLNIIPGLGVPTATRGA